MDEKTLERFHEWERRADDVAVRRELAAMAGDEKTLEKLIQNGVNFIETARPDITSMLLPAGESEPHQIPLMRY